MTTLPACALALSWPRGLVPLPTGSFFSRGGLGGCLTDGYHVLQVVH